MAENLDEIDSSLNGFLPGLSSLGIGAGGDEGWLSSYERQCTEDIEKGVDHDLELKVEADKHSQQLWNMFQTSAMAVAQLYKDRCQGAVLWMPFQNAAETVTALYKASNDIVRYSVDKGIQAGYQKRNKEIVQWAKRRRRNIKRDELLSFLAGKPPPPSHGSSRAYRARSSPSQNREAQCESSTGSFGGSDWASHQDGDLQTFKEALSLTAGICRFGSPSSPLKELKLLTGYDAFWDDHGCDIPVRTSNDLLVRIEDYDSLPLKGVASGSGCLTARAEKIDSPVVPTYVVDSDDDVMILSSDSDTEDVIIIDSDGEEPKGCTNDRRICHPPYTASRTDQQPPGSFLKGQESGFSRVSYTNQTNDKNAEKTRHVADLESPWQKEGLSGSNFGFGLEIPDSCEQPLASSLEKWTEFSDSERWKLLIKPQNKPGLSKPEREAVQSMSIFLTSDNRTPSPCRSSEEDPLSFSLPGIRNQREMGLETVATKESPSGSGGLTCGYPSGFGKREREESVESPVVLDSIDCRSRPGSWGHEKEKSVAIANAFFSSYSINRDNHVVFVESGREDGGTEDRICVLDSIQSGPTLLAESFSQKGTSGLNGGSEEADLANNSHLGPNCFDQAASTSNVSESKGRRKNSSCASHLELERIEDKLVDSTVQSASVDNCCLPESRSSTVQDSAGVEKTAGNFANGTKLKTASNDVCDSNELEVKECSVFSNCELKRGGTAESPPRAMERVGLVSSGGTSSSLGESHSSADFLQAQESVAESEIKFLPGYDWGDFSFAENHDVPDVMEPELNTLEQYDSDTISDRSQLRSPESELEDTGKPRRRGISPDETWSPFHPRSDEPKERKCKKGKRDVAEGPVHCEPKQIRKRTRREGDRVIGAGLKTAEPSFEKSSMYSVDVGPDSTVAKDALRNPAFIRVPNVKLCLQNLKGNWRKVVVKSSSFSVMVGPDCAVGKDSRSNPSSLGVPSECPKNLKRQRQKSVEKSSTYSSNNGRSYAVSENSPRNPADSGVSQSCTYKDVRRKHSASGDLPAFSVAPLTARKQTMISPPPSGQTGNVGPLWEESDRVSARDGLIEKSNFLRMPSSCFAHLELKDRSAMMDTARAKYLSTMRTCSCGFVRSFRHYESLAALSNLSFESYACPLVLKHIKGIAGYCGPIFPDYDFEKVLQARITRMSLALLENEFKLRNLPGFDLHVGRVRKYFHYTKFRVSVISYVNTVVNRIRYAISKRVVVGFPHLSLVECFLYRDAHRLSSVNLLGIRLLLLELSLAGSPSESNMFYDIFVQIWRNEGKFQGARGFVGFYLTLGDLDKRATLVRKVYCDLLYYTTKESIYSMTWDNLYLYADDDKVAWVVKIDRNAKHSEFYLPELGGSFCPFSSMSQLIIKFKDELELNQIFIGCHNELEDNPVPVNPPVYMLGEIISKLKDNLSLPQIERRRSSSEAMQSNVKDNSLASFEVVRDWDHTYHLR